jgi:hypothetical protein
MGGELEGVAMKQLLSLAVIVAVATPVGAQTPGLWPVSTSGGACSMVQTFQDEEFGRHTLRVGFDQARQEVTVATTNSAPEGLGSSGEVLWKIVFLDNGTQKWDEGWSNRHFAYSPAGNAVRFTAAIGGENNVRQFLADLGNSSSIGFLNGNEVVVAYDLLDAGPSVAKLRDCAARALATN